MPLRTARTEPVPHRGQKDPIGIYIHWPFCRQKCPYCDFNSHVQQGVDHARWADALCRELASYAEETVGLEVDSVFFGGGTPSLMAPETVAAVLETVAAHWRLAPEAEITLEANPTSVEAARFAGFAAAGVNRVSVGVQALRDEDLRRLGRLHSVAEARQAIDIAMKYFGRVSADLIYARQDQSLAAWREELAEALDWGLDHLSLYQLTIEPETRFGDLHARGRLRGLPDGELAADLYEATQEMTEAAAMPAYEVSNHARPGAEGRHNLIYWRGGAYLGVGPGAHGRVLTSTGWIATETLRQPEAWLAGVDTRAQAAKLTPIAPEERAVEYMMMALRLRDGMDLARYAALAGGAPDAAALAKMAGDGFVETDAGRLRLTPAGRPLLNAVLRELLPA